MTDLELQALIAAVNDQTARIELETARAKYQNEEPNPWGFVNDTLNQKLRAELVRRGLLS